LTKAGRHKPSFAGVVAYSFALLVVLSLFFHTYYIDSWGDESLLWNEKEVYLFMHGEYRGYHVSYLGYSAEVGKSYFGVIDSPDDKRPYTVIIRITPSGLERYQERAQFDFLTPHDNGLYAWHDGSLWKWAGTHFEKASTEEQQKFGSRPSLPKQDFANLDGWSGHFSSTAMIKVNPPTQVGGVPMTFDFRDGELYVELAGHHYPPQSVYYYHGGRAQHVSKTEYERVFSNH
jgi:hypothetical protein